MKSKKMNVIIKQEICCYCGRKLQIAKKIGRTKPIFCSKECKEEWAEDMEMFDEIFEID